MTNTVPDLSIGLVTRASLAIYAGASWDHNPMHIDIDVARANGREDVFAHGMLVMAYMTRAVTTHLPCLTLTAIDARFMKVMPVGVALTVATKVLESAAFINDDNAARLEITASADGVGAVARATAVIARPEKRGLPVEESTHA